MTIDDDDRVEGEADVADAEENEFDDKEDAELVVLDDDVEIVDGEVENGDVEEVEALTDKELSARSLEVRRAIEERMAEKQFHEDVDYLDFD